MKDEIMNQLIFCNAKIRPECILNTNLCCVICEFREQCTIQNQKIKPCTSYDEDEGNCQFLI